MDCCAGAKAKKVGVIIEMYGLGGAGCAASPGSFVSRASGTSQDDGESFALGGAKNDCVTT